MKRIVVFLGLFLLSFTQAFADVSVEIKGMTCQVCVRSVTKELKKIESIDPATIKVSLEDKKASFKELKVVPNHKIELAVKKAGYQVVKILR